MSNLFALMVCGGLALLGWRQGVLRTAKPLLGIAAGYLCALLLFKPLGGLVAGLTGAAAMVAYPIGGLLAFVAGSLAMRTAIRRMLRERKGQPGTGMKRSRGDRVGGAAIGAMTGAFVTVVVVWGVGSLTQLYGSTPGDTAEPRRERMATRMSAAVAERVAYSAMRMATDDAGMAAGLARAVARPAEAVAALNRAARSPGLQRVAENRAFQRAFLEGDAQRMARQPVVRDLLRDPDFVEAARTLGVVPGDADAAELSRELAEALAPIGLTVSELREDEAFLAELAGSDVRSRLAEGDVLAIARDPRMQGLIERVAEVLAEKRRQLQ